MNISKYENFIQQDFKVEHLIMYVLNSDIEWDNKIDNSFKGLESLKQKYIESGTFNRKPTFNIYEKLLQSDLKPEEKEQVINMQKSYFLFVDELKEIIIKYNISHEENYIKKTSMNTRKKGYISSFVNHLFSYYSEYHNHAYEVNIENLFFLLKSFIEEFETHEALKIKYLNERLERYKSSSTLEKSKSSFTFIKTFIENFPKKIVSNITY